MSCLKHDMDTSTEERSLKSISLKCFLWACCFVVLRSQNQSTVMSPFLNCSTNQQPVTCPTSNMTHTSVQKDDQIMHLPPSRNLLALDCFIFLLNWTWSNWWLDSLEMPLPIFPVHVACPHRTSRQLLLPIHAAHLDTVASSSCLWLV
jgi:hypothetical protein